MTHLPRAVDLKVGDRVEFHGAAFTHGAKTLAVGDVGTIIAVHAPILSVGSDGYAVVEFSSGIHRMVFPHGLESGHYRKPQEQFRTREGRYDFDGDWERPCVCGHPLGVHAAESPRPCFNGDPGLGDSTQCDCEKFRLSRRKSQAKR